MVRLKAHVDVALRCMPPTAVFLEFGTFQAGIEDRSLGSGVKVGVGCCCNHWNLFIISWSTGMISRIKYVRFSFQDWMSVFPEMLSVTIAVASIAGMLACSGVEYRFQYTPPFASKEA